jgi:hypothetical protein
MFFFPLFTFDIVIFTKQILMFNCYTNLFMEKEKKRWKILLLYIFVNNVILFYNLL